MAKPKKISELVAQLEYDFEYQLRYNDELIEQKKSLEYFKSEYFKAKARADDHRESAENWANLAVITWLIIIAHWFITYFN